MTVDTAGSGVLIDDAVVRSIAILKAAEAAELERRGVRVNDVAYLGEKLEPSLEKFFFYIVGIAVTDPIRNACANWAVPSHQRREGCRRGFRVTSNAYNRWGGSVGIEGGKLEKCGVVFGEDMTVTELGDEVFFMLFDGADEAVGVKVGVAFEAIGNFSCVPSMAGRGTFEDKPRLAVEIGISEWDELDQYSIAQNGLFAVSAVTKNADDGDIASPIVDKPDDTSLCDCFSFLVWASGVGWHKGATFRAVRMER